MPVQPPVLSFKLASFFEQDARSPVCAQAMLKMGGCAQGRMVGERALSQSDVLRLGEGAGVGVGEGRTTPGRAGSICAPFVPVTGGSPLTAGLGGLFSPPGGGWVG